MNFAQAAMLVQSSACVYSKKVRHGIFLLDKMQNREIRNWNFTTKDNIKSYV